MVHETISMCEYLDICISQGNITHKAQEAAQ